MKNGTGIVESMGWKLLERFGVQGTQFVLQIILARMLEPEHYGVLSLMIIFTTLANVFVQNGFSTALVQNKDVEEDDYSSVFWTSLGVAGILYVLMFFAAPYIALFYQMPDIVLPFRVLSLMLIPGAFNSVQIAKVSRTLAFKKIFQSNVAAMLISGIAGIAVAMFDGGVWALVIQSLLNVFVSCVIMWFTVKWRPKLVYNISRVKVLFSFGWKLLVSSLIETLYQDIRSLVIGKKYDSGTLGYYNRGKQFPQFVINAINGTMQSVMLPVIAEKQDDRAKVKSMMRTSIKMSSYIIFPMMAGLAAVASPLIELLLTEKWLACVPYMQIYCFTLAFYPVHTCNLQTINALGRSDLFLKLELIKKSYGIVALIIAVFYFDSPIAIAFTGCITTLISCFINASPNKKLVGYSYAEQVKDVLPALIASMIMFAVTFCVGFLPLTLWLLLGLQIAVGIGTYILLSMVTCREQFGVIVSMIRK